MKAMILAAGRGQRMQSLTDNTPKPLLTVNGMSLIERNLYKLKKAGITEVVINVCYLPEQIIKKLGDGNNYGMQITYSIEQKLLDTGGGIKKALPLLGDEPFIVVSSDVWSDYPFENLAKKKTTGAHLVLVDNPEYHNKGDFGLIDNQVVNQSDKKLTYANIALINPNIFDNYHDAVFPLGNVFRNAADKKIVTGEYYHSVWFNVGTPDELDAVKKHVPYS